MDAITFAIFATAAGAVTAAGLITAITELVKRVAPTIDQRVSGALLAFVFSAALYVFTAIALAPATLDGYLNIFVAWLSCATSAVGIHTTVVRTAVQAGAAAVKAGAVKGVALAKALTEEVTVESTTTVTSTGTPVMPSTDPVPEGDRDTW